MNLSIQEEFFTDRKNSNSIQTDRNTGAIFECIGTRIGTIDARGGTKPVLIMELYSDASEHIAIKFFNCKCNSKGSYAVPRNGDFAKLYRLTIGENPDKRFSKSQQLLKHFHGYCFVIPNYELQTTRNGKEYLKVKDIKPKKPIYKESWTNAGILKKSSNHRRMRPVTDSENEDTNRKLKGNLVEKKWQPTGNDKSPKTQYTRGLEADFNPTKKLQTSSKTTKPLQVPDNPKIFEYRQQANESNDEYFDRAIEESFANMAWFNHSPL